MLQSTLSDLSKKELLAKVKRQVLDFGNSELVNEFVFHNYSRSITYFDEDLEKTALYLDTLSSTDLVNTYIHK
jgi:hypothetical protein